MELFIKLKNITVNTTQNKCVTLFLTRLDFELVIEQYVYQISENFGLRKKMVVLKVDISQFFTNMSMWRRNLFS